MKEVCISGLMLIAAMTSSSACGLIGQQPCGSTIQSNQSYIYMPGQAPATVTTNGNTSAIFRPGQPIKTCQTIGNQAFCN